MKKIKEKKLGFILLGIELSIVSLIFIIFGATGVGFKDTRLKNANNSLATLIPARDEIKYDKVLSGEERIKFENPKRKNVYVKVGVKEENKKMNAWGYSANEVRSTHERGGGEMSRRDDYYEYVFNFDYFDIDEILIEFNTPVLVSSIGVFYIQ